MVYAFIIHTLPPDACRVLFSCTFGLEDKVDGVEQNVAVEGQNQTDSDGNTVGETRAIRKEQIALVARQIQSEFSFLKAVSENLVHSDGQEDWMRDAETGVFRLAAGDPFLTEKVAVWMAAGKAGFVLVCETHENRLQAQNQLQLLARNLQEYVRAVRQPWEVLEKPDRVTAVLHHILPSGRILFMNHAVIKQIEKELELTLKVK